MARKKLNTLEPLKFVPQPLTNTNELIIKGLKQNNLKNLDITIRHNSITTVVGPSGSGKSSLAFDTLFAEGRWRFIESLSTYTRLFLERMDRPDVELIQNIRPAIAIEQKNPVRTSRSTVATATEIYDYLRVLFAKIGIVECSGCGVPVKRSEPGRLASLLIEEAPGKKALLGFTINIPKRQPNDFNKITNGLIRKGFIRILQDGEVIDLTDDDDGTQNTPLNSETNEMHVITDRLILKEKERTRLTGSIETAFAEGGGEMWVSNAGGGEMKTYTTSFRCASCGITARKPTPVLFSFNHPVGACPECKGFGNILEYDKDLVVPDRSVTLRDGAVEPWTKPSYRWWLEDLEPFALRRGIDLDIPFSKLTESEVRLVFAGDESFEGVDGFFKELERKKYKLHIRVFLSRYKGQVSCPACEGRRLKPEALCVKIAGKSIALVTALTIKEARDFFISLELTPMEAKLSRETLRQIGSKLDFLNQTGLGYITLTRLTKTLSGGEAQRVSLANQIGSSLSGVLYILDEPSIGLHPRDIDMLIVQIKKLAARANTVVLVEHDPSVMRASDNILEFGPGAGTEGGRLVYSGTSEEFLTTARTLTSDFLTGRRQITIPRWRRRGSGESLLLKGATGNNLKGVNFRVPLGTFTCVTGVSGSGKSTLVIDTLYNAIAARLKEKGERALPFVSLNGDESLGGVRLINQEPIGRTPRSNPITYIGGFDDIRRFFAAQPTARAAGLTPGAFSFNVPGGRCEACKGEGAEKLEMYFLPDIYTQCGSCGGKRYKPQTLEVCYKRKNIFDVLNMTFDDASRFFPADRKTEARFSIIKEVGLGYLKLGQPATTLSGGEAQRLKIARELSTGTARSMLYILDEPTTGLHMTDIKKLLSVIGRLADDGNTVLTVEHNLDCIKTADHIIEIGPEGGDEGGRIVAEGSPEEIVDTPGSYTGQYLKRVLLPAE